MLAFSRLHKRWAEGGRRLHAVLGDRASWALGLSAVSTVISVNTYQSLRQNKLETLEEQWSSLQKQLQLVADFRRRHATPDDPQHYADVMYGYYDALYQGKPCATEHASEVADARRDNQVFWDKFLGRSHRWVPFLPFSFPGGFEDLMPLRKDLDTKQARWSGRAAEYQRLLEPVDIANWYAKRIHEGKHGHYIDQLDRGERNKRPGRFNRIDAHVEEEAVQAALSKAREYKTNCLATGGASVVKPQQMQDSAAADAQGEAGIAADDKR